MFNKNNIIEEKIVHPWENISKALRDEIWFTYIREIIKAKCFCCERNYINLFNYHSGHIVAHSKGGFTIVENLRPICIECNLSRDTEKFIKNQIQITLTLILGYNYNFKRNLKASLNPQFIPLNCCISL